MEREANYAAVGAFVLVVALAAALFVYWYSGTRVHRKYDHYEIYFNGTVSGLEQGAAVRYLGVRVGRVVEMRIDPRDAGRVEVIAAIDSTTPISPRTLAELDLQGLTGLLYIDLQLTARPAAPSVPSLKYPVIRAAPSEFDVFMAQLPRLSAAAGGVIGRLNRMLSDRNIDDVSRSLDNLSQASSSLPETVRSVNALLVQLRSATAELGTTAKSAQNVMATAGPEIVTTVRRLQTVADNLAQATDQLDRMVAENRTDVRSFTRTSLPEIESFVREGRAAAVEIRQLSASLRQNPSQLLYKPVPAAVEIPR
ncbi:MAG TPA: MlaD family protein [Steroidobacteraceae bacterium]|jgi:phospholipid/cholesterol/gamma-HCH transport system substrate-binding protein